MDNNALYRDNTVTRKKVTEYLSREEIRTLTARSDVMGAWSIASTWLLITVLFAVMAWAMQQVIAVKLSVFVIAIAMLGGRQLALAIITHEATHNTLFKTKWANESLTDWLCARPIGLDLAKYRAHHFIHHMKTGTAEDTDISLIAGLPTTKASLARKFIRDLTGLTGLKFLFGRILMDAEIIKWTVATDVERLQARSVLIHLRRFLVNAWPTAATNLIIFFALYASGHAYLYLAWAIAYLIPYPLFIRIRALAEHAGTELSTDMFKNTRTTKAGWIARTFVAPLHVNYHIEHHAMASVPWFRLPKMHRLLRERDQTASPPSYWQVMKIVSSAG